MDTYYSPGFVYYFSINQIIWTIKLKKKNDNPLAKVKSFKAKGKIERINSCCIENKIKEGNYEWKNQKS